MFDELFDRTDRVFEGSTESETIALAAIRDIDGNVYTGSAHATIINKMEDAGWDLSGSIDEFNELEFGFVTSTGRFVDRPEATVIAQKAKQVKQPRGLLTHDQLESMDQLTK